MSALAKVSLDLAERVDKHMLKTWPGSPIGNWQTAVDYRDGTAIVIWRSGDVGPAQPSVRGMMLYRWLGSLRDAGFTAEARTDMACFGRPDEESPVAWWLQITGWAEPEPEPVPAPLERYPRPMGGHRVTALPSDPQLPGLDRPSGYQFTYWAPGDFPRPVTYTLEYEHQGYAEALSVPLPEWLAALAEEHRPCLGDRSRVWGCER
ncbi:hypothetical protein [Streptomyces scopuliridis]|uniref:hypothetical protein n=1 Tax=Streptomyces scopuliridis TaxID=452529 RepID=UPI00367AD0C0